MSRKKEQAELLFQFGALFGPVLKWMESPGSFDSDEKTRILARLFADIPSFQSAFHKVTISEPGHNYQVQWSAVVGQLSPLPSYAGRSESQFCPLLRTVQEEIFSAIQQIPVPVDSAIHEAHTPFSTYCLLKNLCSTVQHRIIWMDRLRWTLKTGPGNKVDSEVHF